MFNLTRARMSTVGIGMALIAPALLLSTASAQASTTHVTRVGAECVINAGVTGSPNQKGTDYYTTTSCPTIKLVWAKGSGNFAGFFKQDGVWVEGSLKYQSCSGSCGVTLLTNVASGTEVTVNNKTANDGDDPIKVSV